MDSPTSIILQVDFEKAVNSKRIKDIRGFKEVLGSNFSRKRRGVDLMISEEGRVETLSK